MSIPAVQPTRVRYLILALTVVVAVLLYLDRYCLGYVTPYVRESLGLTSGETGFMLGAFFLTYAFGQLPGGWLADRFGSRCMLSIYLAVWSVLTGLIGLADGFLILLLLRFGCRIGGAIVPGITGFLIIVFTPLSAGSLLKSPSDILDPRLFARNVVTPAPQRSVAKQVALRLQATMSPQTLATFQQIATGPE